MRRSVLAAMAVLAAALAVGAALAQPAPPLALEQVRARQPALMAAMLSALPHERPGVQDAYVLAAAGDGEMDVFLSEARRGGEILARTLDARGTALLSNDPATWGETPLTSPANLKAAIEGVAAKMNPAEDVLVVFLTSHGVPAGLALAAPRFPERPVVSPGDLAGWLDAAGVQTRVVIVSACYSGVFIAPLARADTLVITASRPDRTSFGCESGRTWTYFGEALFAHGLKASPDFERAFAIAERTVAAWEFRDGLKPPSEPQIAMGEAARARLARSGSNLR